MSISFADSLCSHLIEFQAKVDVRRALRQTYMIVSLAKQLFVKIIHIMLIIRHNVFFCIDLNLKNEVG